MFDYDKYSQFEKNISKTEEVVIGKHFDKIVADNSNFEDMSQPEFDAFFQMFRQGWILHEMFVKGV